MEQDKQRCPTCGANTKAFWHTLTPGLVSVLVEAIKFVHTHNKNQFHLQRDLNLSKTAYNNAQKLRYHALIAKVEEKSGWWCITSRGGQFLRGEISVPLKVKTFRNRVIEHSSEVVHIGELRNKVPHFESEFAYEYQRSAKDFIIAKTLL